MFGRSRWPRRFLRSVSRIAGAKITVVGGPVRPHSLLVCNHLSWLDIPVMAAATGCAFVSKDRLGHGFLHWLADQNDTLYVRRDHRRGAPGQAEAIARRLGQPQPLALFPEGTTGPGTHLLPFRTTLFSAVAPPPDGVEVRPVAIDYGESAPQVGWHDEPGLDNVLRILGRTQGLAVTVRITDRLEPIADRKALANAASEAIAEALTSSPAHARL
jgi:lyso-ornithine lipid O-acyltransferase